MRHEPNIRCPCSPDDPSCSTFDEKVDRKGRLISFKAQCQKCDATWDSENVVLEERNP